MLQRRVVPAGKYVRRTLQVVALVGTLFIGVIALALIVSQTPWFHDWLRKYVVRQAGQYVNGTVSIGSLGGNLFYGIQLGDVAIDVNGEHIVTLKQVEITYSVSELVSQGATIRQIRIEEPFVLARRDAGGWNLAGLVKRQQTEADRQGPRRPISLPNIEIVNGRAAIDDRAPSPSYRLPSRIEGLNVKAGFEYAPVHYSLTLDRFSLTGKAPELTVQNLAGRFGTRDDDLNVEKLYLQTAQSSVTVDGVIRQYLSTPTLQVTIAAPKLSLAEFAGVLPPLRGYDLHPAFDVKAEGRQDALRLAMNVKSEAGDLSGEVTADLKAPDLGVRGDVTVRALDLAPLVRNPTQKSDITGHAKLDLRIAGPASAPVLDRLRGRVAFQGPKAMAAGYTATAVRVTADLAGHRIALDGRGNAYGGTATAKGFIVVPASTGQPTAIDLAGAASHIDLARLPRNLNAPRIPTNLNATAYRVKGSVGSTTSIDGSATMAESTIAGGTILGGTSGEFALTSGRRGLQSLTYAARGEVRDLNLQRVGEAFRVVALAKPEYDSRINTIFDVKGSGVAADSMRIDASGTATDSTVFGGTLPRITYEAHLADNALAGRANGEFRDFDPARVAANPQYKGRVSGTVDAAFGVKNLSAPLTPDGVTADGRVTLARSEVAGLQIDTADIQGQYANRRGNLRQGSMKGPDIDVQASGPIALDETGQTNVKYHVAATNLERLGQLAKQPGLSGAAILDGTVTGNAASLAIAGTLDGSNLGYQADKALDLNSAYTVTVPDLTVARARVQAQTTATFLQVGRFQINLMTAATTYADQRLDFQTHIAESPSGGQAQAAAGQGSSGTRELDASGRVIFHPDHKEIHLPTLAVRTRGVEWKTAPGSEPTIQYGSNRVQFQNVKLVNADQVLNVDGSLSLGDTPETDGIQVHAENVDIAQLDALTLQNRGFSGRLNADAKLVGTAKAPAVSGHVAVANGGFQQFKYQSLTMDGSFANERLAVDAKLVQTPGVELTAKGSVPLSAFKTTPGVTGHVAETAADPIDLHIQSSRIDLGIVQGVTSQLANVTGTLQADVHVTGSGRDPHLNGYVDVQNGAFGVVQAGVTFSGMSTRIELQQDRIRVPKFQILDQHGKALTIQGELAVHERQAGAVNVSLDADDFKIVDNELGNVHVESHLKLTGEIRKPRLEGELRTDAARLEVDKILLMFANPYSEEALPDVLSAQETTGSEKGADQALRDAFVKGRQVSAEKAPGQNATAPVPAAPQTGVFSALALNVHFVAPDNLVMRGDDLRPGGPNASQIGSVNATVGADLQIEKRENGPITLRGTANTVRGFYEFQGRRFTIQRDGTLQFQGLRQINPDIDVSAERVIPNLGVTARIHITGTARAPQLQLTSEPPLPEADILSLIVFNRSVNELGTGERASLVETAGGIASGFVASSLGKSIGKALDVDLFEITTSDVATGETAGGVTLGKQVSERAFVRFSQQFGQRSFTEFMLEYQLARFLRTETRVSPETSGVANRLTQRRVERAGVDLIFFFSY